MAGEFLIKKYGLEADDQPESKARKNTVANSVTKSILATPLSLSGVRKAAKTQESSRAGNVKNLAGIGNEAGSGFTLKLPTPKTSTATLKNGYRAGMGSEGGNNLPSLPSAYGPSLPKANAAKGATLRPAEKLPARTETALPGNYQPQKNAALTAAARRYTGDLLPQLPTGKLTLPKPYGKQPTIAGAGSESGLSFTGTQLDPRAILSNPGTADYLRAAIPQRQAREAADDNYVIALPGADEPQTAYPIELLTDPTVKLTDDQKRYAQQLLNEYQRRAGAQYFKTREELQEQAQMQALRNKLYPMPAFALGALSTVGVDKAPEIPQEAFDENPWLISVANPYGKQTFQAAQTQHPGMYLAGQFAGEAGKYALGNALVSSIPAVNALTAKGGEAISHKLGGKVSKEAVARLLNGRATDLPIDLVNAAMDADSPQAFARQLGIDTALGLGTDIGIEAIGKLWRMGKSAAQKRLGNHSGGYVPLGTEDLTDYLNTGKKQSTRNEKRRMLARGESPILTSNAEVEDFITKSITGEQQQAIKAYGKAGDRLKNAVLEASDGTIDISNRYLELSSDDLKHSFSGHSVPKQAGDIALSITDYLNIPQYVDEFDDVIYAIRLPDQSVKIQLGKKINGHTIITEVVSNERNSLRLKNMWGVDTAKYERKYKNRSASNRAATGKKPVTSQFPSAGKAPANSISDSVQKSNGFMESPSLQGGLFRRGSGEVNLDPLSNMQHAGVTGYNNITYDNISYVNMSYGRNLTLQSPTEAGDRVNLGEAFREGPLGGLEYARLNGDGNITYVNISDLDKSYENNSYTNRSYLNNSYVNKSDINNSYANKSYLNKGYADRTYGESIADARDSGYTLSRGDNNARAENWKSSGLQDISGNGVFSSGRKWSSVFTEGGTTLKNNRTGREYRFQEIPRSAYTEEQIALARRARQDGIDLHFYDGGIQDVKGNIVKEAAPGGQYIGDGIMVLRPDGASYDHELYHHFESVIPKETEAFGEFVNAHANMSNSAVQTHLQNMIDEYRSVSPTFEDSDIWREIAAGFYGDQMNGRGSNWEGFFSQQEELAKQAQALRQSFDAYRGKTGNAGGTNALPRANEPDLLKDLELKQGREPNYRANWPEGTRKDSLGGLGYARLNGDGEITHANISDANNGYGNNSYLNNSPVNKSDIKNSYVDKSYLSKSYADKSYLNRSYADRTYGGSIADARDSGYTLSRGDINANDARRTGRSFDSNGGGLYGREDGSGTFGKEISRIQENKRTSPEPAGTYIARATQEGKIVEADDFGNIVSYKPAREIGQNASEAQEILRRRGFDSFAYEGTLSRNKDGLTTEHLTDAQTLANGRIGIKSDCTLPGKEIAGHEGFHSITITNPEIAKPYLNKMSSPVSGDKKLGYNRIIDKIGLAMYGEKYSPINASQQANILKELGAQIGGKMDYDPVQSRELFSGILEDFDGTYAAWKQMNAEFDSLKSSWPGGISGSAEGTTYDLLRDLTLKPQEPVDYLKEARLNISDDNIPHANKSYLDETYFNNAHPNSAYPDTTYVNNTYSNGTYSNKNHLNGSYPNDTYVNKTYLNGTRTNGTYSNGAYENGISDALDIGNQHVTEPFESEIRGQHRSFGEPAGTFIDRAGKEGKRVDYDAEGNLFAYRGTQATGNAAQAKELLEKRGFHTEAYEGIFERNKDGRTIQHMTDAQTLADGRVLIKNGTEIAPVEIAGHEGLHSISVTNPEIAQPFYDHIASPKDPTKKEFLKKIEFKIGNEMYGAKYNPENAAQRARIIKELASQIGGKIDSDPEWARTFFSDYLDDFDQTYELWKQTNAAFDALQGRTGKNAAGEVYDYLRTEGGYFNDGRRSQTSINPRGTREGYRRNDRKLAWREDRPRTSESDVRGISQEEIQRRAAALSEGNRQINLDPLRTEGGYFNDGRRAQAAFDSRRTAKNYPQEYTTLDGLGSGEFKEGRKNDRRAGSQGTGGAEFGEINLDPLSGIQHAGMTGYDNITHANMSDLNMSYTNSDGNIPHVNKSYLDKSYINGSYPNNSYSNDSYLNRSYSNKSYLNEGYPNKSYGKNTVGAAQSAYPHEQRVSRVRSNTIENSPMFSRTERELLNPNEFQYDVISERQSIAQAKQRLQVDFDGEVKTLMDKAYFDGTDVDTAFGVLEQFRREAQGLPLDSPEQQRVIDWVRQIQQKGTEAGQRVQAYAKYSRTPEGAAVKAQKYVADHLDKLKKSDPKLINAMDDLADKLGKIAEEYQYDMPSNPEETVKKLRRAVQELADDRAYKRLDLDEAFTERVIQSLQEGRAGKDTFAELLKEVENIPSLTGEDLMEIMDTMAKAENLPAYSKARLELENQAYKIVADKFPSSFMDKWNAWRYMAMLGNPRTHIRNVVGNTVFGGVTRIKNDVGALLEAATDRINKAAGGQGIARTKTLLNPFDGADRALQRAAKEDYGNVYGLVTGGGKYNPARMIEDNRTVFRRDRLEKLRKKNMDWLEMGDNLALQTRYSENMARYLKANGYGPEIFQDASEAALDEARGYAIAEAQKATFRDYSKAAETISNFSRINPLTNVVTEGLLPFKKTPVNIVKRGVEYSPLGLAKGINDAFKSVRRGSVSASKAIDELAAGLTGSGIMLLGGFLASQGYLTGAGSEDDRERSYNKMMGEQSYALKLGDHSYTLDWAAPAAMPLFAGVELWNAMEQQDGTITAGDFLDAMERITGPVVEMSMLQGLNSAVKTAGYSKADAVSAMAGNTVANYFGQAVPTIFGQAARTIDGTRRNSYYVDQNSQLPQTLQIALQKNMAKIPFASKLLTPYVDAWGRESEQKPAALRAFENFLSPGYLSKTRTTPADDLIKDLYLQTGNSAILPSNAQKSFLVDGERVRLTAAQYAQASKVRGQTAQGLIAGLGKLPAFAGLESADKEKVISDAYSYATAIAKQQVSDYQPDGWIEKAQEAKRAGIPVETYLLYKNAFSELEGYEDGNGEYISKPDQQAQLLLADPTLTDRQKNLLDDLLISDVVVMQKNVKRDYTSPEALAVSQLPDAQQDLYNTPSVKKAVGNVSNFIKVQKIISEIKADKDEYGNSISGTAKPKEIAAIASALNVSSEQANEIYNEMVVYKHDISELSSKQQQAYRNLAGKYRINEAWFLDCLNAMAVIEGSKDDNGKTISGSLKQKRYQKLLQMGMNESGAQVFLSEVYGYKW